MKRYVIGNWKCHKSSSDGQKWLDRFSRLYRPHKKVEVILAPSLLTLESITSYAVSLKLDNFSFAAQDISPFPRGNYTGAVAADMVKKMASYVIVGHSERRRYFHETDQDMINKATEAADCGLVPIICLSAIDKLASLRPLLDIETDRMIVAYTPVDALHFKIPESPESVEEAVGKIHNKFPGWEIVYGGSLLPENVGDYCTINSLNGIFSGSGSLEPEMFIDFFSQLTATL